MKKIIQFEPSLAKKLLYESKHLITKGVLSFDEQWKLSSQPNSKYLIFLVNPNNAQFKQHVCKQEGISLSSSSTWFEKEMENITNAKENITEYYEYLSNYEFRIQTKLNDSTLYERWSTYPEHYILYLKTWNGQKYEPASINAFAVKILSSVKKKIGYGGSIWVSKRYRPDSNVKYNFWLLHLALCHQANVSYEYGYAIDGSDKSLGLLAKTGMVSCQYKFTEIGLPVEIMKKEIDGEKFQRVESFDEYEKIINERFRKGIIYENLREFYYSKYFLGCYYNDNMDFQIWKGGKSKILKTQEELQTYLIFNESHTSNMVKFGNMINQLRFNILPSIHQSNEKILLLFLLDNVHMKDWILQTFKDNECISTVGSILVLQNVSKLFKAAETREQYEMECLLNNQIEMRNFLDPRDLSSAVLIGNSKTNN